MNIGLDIMGGDFAPEQAILGVQMYLQQKQDTSVHLILIGDPEKAAEAAAAALAEEEAAKAVAAAAEAERLRAEQAALREKGIYRGIGLAAMIEVTNRRKVIDEPTDPLQERIDLMKRQKISEKIKLND